MATNQNKKGDMHKDSSSSSAPKSSSAKSPSAKSSSSNAAGSTAKQPGTTGNKTTKK